MSSVTAGHHVGAAQIVEPSTGLDYEKFAHVLALDAASAERVIAVVGGRPRRRD